MKVLLVLWLVFTTASVFADARCQGGDGPVPFSEVAGPDQSTVSIYDTSESVERFEIWEKSEKLIYQSASSAVIEHQLVTGQERLLGVTSASLQRTEDPKERYLLLSGIGKILDALDLSHVLSAPATIGYTPFWGRSELFTIQSLSASQKGIQELKYSVFDPLSETERNSSCKLAAPAGSDYQLGRGHQSSQAFLYRAIEVSNGTRLSLYHLNLAAQANSGRCQLIALGEYTDTIKGRVQDVVQFGKKGYYLTRTDHAESNLLFDSPQGCGYFNLGRQKLLIPSYREPVFFTYARARGLEMYRPAQRQVIPVLKGAIHYPVQEDQIWLSENGKDLWLSLRSHQSRRGYLLRTEIDAGQ